MLNLNVITPITYISPSAFNMWKQCEHKFYLLRLAGYPYLERKQTKAMAIGLAVDAFIKDAIVSRREIMNPGPHLDLKSNLLSIPMDIINDAKIIAKAYIDSGFFDLLLNAKTLYLENTRYRQEGIPILGKIDAIVDGVPLDWKCRGFVSEKLPSPTRGYTKCRSISFSNGVMNEGPHPDRIWIEAVNLTWAIQLLFYNWLLKTMPYDYIIHEIIPTKDGIKVSELTGSFSNTFAFKIQHELEALWLNIKELKTNILEPDVRPHICEAYNSICEVADKCNAYKKTLGNAGYRKKFG